MSIRQTILLMAAMTCGTGVAQAQDNVAKMVADGHYRGAKQLLQQRPGSADEHDKQRLEAEALELVCDYVLGTSGTADRIGTWVDEHPASPYAAPLRDMQRTLLVKDGRYDEALVLFFDAEAEGECLSCKTDYAYPLGALSGEAYDYNRVLYRMAGERMYDTGNYAQAIQYLSLGEETRNSLYRLGMSHFHMAAYKQAAECLTRSAGTDRDATAQNAWLHAGLAHLQLGNKKAAQTAFQQASDIAGDAKVREEALYNYALTLHEGASAGFGQSVSVMERFLNDYPNSQHASKVAGYLTEVYFTTKNYQAALASINKIKQPNAEILKAKQRVLYNLGVQALANGNTAGALNYANQAVALGQRDTEALAASYYLKGESEYRMGNYAAAANALRQALPNSKAQYTLAYALFKQRQYTAARPVFEQFVTSQLGKERPALAADACNRIGDCCLDARQYDKAFASYQRAIDTDRTQGDYALLQQAYIQGLRGDYAAKVQLIERISADYTDSQYASEALFEQGRAYVQQGNADAAAQTFRDLTERYPQSVNARKAGNELAMLLAESGKTGEAIDAYKKMIADHPNTQEAQTALTNLKDLYTAQGRVNEYMELAGRMGKTFTADELDEMVGEAAVKAMTDGNYRQAQQYYTQLQAQTPSDDIRRNAQLGLMRSSYANGDLSTTIVSASAVLDNASRFAPEVKAEARMTRADCYLRQNNSDSAVADLQLLVQDNVTVYGAQGTVRLAQYAYDTAQYDSAETVLTRFIDSGTSHTYWLARAFVLLSDVYTAQGRTVEAQQTLLSLKSSYTESEEINKMVEERLK